MALPEITAPAGTPAFLVAGHAQQSHALHGNVGMGTGHARKRRLRTAAPRIVTVAWDLSAAQMLAVDQWYETALQVGARPFAAAVKDLGADALMWWTARWLAPYQAEPDETGYWRATGQLLLTGEGSSVGPVITSAKVEFVAALTGTAKIAVVNSAAVEFVAALLSVQQARVEFVVALIGVKDGAPPSDDHLDERWIWMGLNYAASYSADVSTGDSSLQHQLIGV